MYENGRRHLNYVDHVDQQQTNSSVDNEGDFIIGGGKQYNSCQLKTNKTYFPTVHNSEGSQLKILDSPLFLTTNNNILNYSSPVVMKNEPIVQMDLPQTSLQNGCESFCPKIIKGSVSSQQQQPLIMELRQHGAGYSNIGKMINCQTKDIVGDEDDDISSLGSTTSDNILFCLCAPFVKDPTPSLFPQDPPSTPKRYSVSLQPRRRLCSLQQRRVDVTNDDNRRNSTTVTNTIRHHSFLPRPNTLPPSSSDYTDTLLRSPIATSSYHNMTLTPC